jgi:hypothetical protein
VRSCFEFNLIHCTEMWRVISLLSGFECSDARIARDGCLIDVAGGVMLFLYVAAV